MVALVSASADRHGGHPTEGSFARQGFRGGAAQFDGPTEAFRPALAGDYGIPLRARQEQNDSQPPIDVAGEVDGMTAGARQPTAEDHVRLLRDHDAVAEQLVAADAVLVALGRSSSDADADAVMTTVAESARRLCQCQGVTIYLLHGEEFELAAMVGLPPDFRSYVAAHPLRRDRKTMSGRVALDRRIEQVSDVLADPGYGRRDVQEIAGYRTMIAAPLILDDEVVGAISLFRTKVEPFDERATAMLQTFAAQAAAVVRNLHLVRELQGRQRELARKVEQLQALNEVGEIVSSTLVLDEVLFKIILNAVRFAECDGGSIMEYVEAERRFLARTTYPSSQELLSGLRKIKIGLDETLVGRAAREGHPIGISDIALVDRDVHLELLYADGWRSVLAVPVLRDDQIIGVMVVRRKTPGDFSGEVMDFMETFAGQSALAVFNARLFRELERKSAQLEVASEHKSDFLASMSHELRTPLNAVIGFSEVLLERMFGDLNERQEEYLRDILNSGKHLLELLNEILDLSKVEAGRMELELSVFPVRGVIEDTIALVRERAALHGIALTLEIDPALDLIESDELRFKQVMLNLLSNAVKFTPDGGQIVVKAARTERRMTVTVSDNGMGIPAEDQERIFEAFHQGRRGPSREEGTGLGLTLCRRIVALMGGVMTLQSEVGVGSTFGFTVPVLAANGSVEPDNRDDADPVVVVVDDDRRSLDLISAYLDGHGVRVVRAWDGNEGLDRIRRLQPVAALLDIRLPGIDGWEVLEALQADPETEEVPVVIVSILDERSRGLAAGAAEYLVKPVSRDDLLDALRRLRVLPSNNNNRERHL
jgi:signal transduction histidine kinase/ActR/RegA family two-component response regulator